MEVNPISLSPILLNEYVSTSVIFFLLRLMLSFYNLKKNCEMNSKFNLNKTRMNPHFNMKYSIIKEAQKFTSLAKTLNFKVREIFSCFFHKSLRGKKKKKHV